jgi:hypothetical protein
MFAKISYSIQSVFILEIQTNLTCSEDHVYYQHDSVNIAPSQKIIKQTYLNSPKEDSNKFLLIFSVKIDRVSMIFNV